MHTARRAPRGIALLGMAAVAVVAVTACGHSSATPPIIYITPSPGPATPLPSGVTPEPTAAPPSLTTFLVESSAPDNRWTVTFKKPVVAGLPNDVAGKINDAIAARVNGYIGDFNGKGLPALANGAAPSTLQGDYSIGIDTRSVISLRFTIQTFVSGAAHRTGTPGSITFSATTGETVALDSLFTDKTAALSKIAADCKSSLSAELGSDLTWDGAATSLDFFAKAWVITPAGLEFNFAQGALASQAAGMPSATVRWSELKSLIDPRGPAGEFAR